MRLFVLAIATAMWPAQGAAADLEQVLAAMDKAASGFEDMTANLKRTDHTAVINDMTEESGRVRMKRARSGDISLRIDFQEPEPRSVAFANRKAEIYYPKLKTVQVYDLGKYRNLVDQFLLLGFGSSGTELKKNYSLKLIGEETVQGEPVSRLELIPKSSSALEHLKKVELWINAAGYPAQQKFYRPSGDYTLVEYTGLKVNVRLADRALRLELPGGIKREYPQK